MWEDDWGDFITYILRSISSFGENICVNTSVVTEGSGAI